jgi:hypothetical protein
MHGKYTSISDRLYSQTSMFHIKIVILHYFILRQIALALKPICKKATLLPDIIPLLQHQEALKQITLEDRRKQELP